MQLSKRISQVSESKTIKLIPLVNQLKKEGKDVINFAAGEPDFPTPNEIKAATKKALDENKTKYTPTLGIQVVKEAIAKKVSEEDNIPVTAKNIAITNGSKQALYQIMQLLLNPGDEVIVPVPYWVTFPEQVKLADATPIFSQTKNHQLDIENIKSLISKKTKAIILNTPNNPSGAVYEEESLKKVIELAEQHDFYVIADEAYDLLLYDNLKKKSIASLSPLAKKRTITTQSFSKDFAMTGFRVGCIIADETFISGVNKLQGHLTGSVCTFAQLGAIEALNLPKQTVESMRSTFEKRRDLAFTLATELFPCVKPSGAFYLFPNIEKHLGKKWSSSEEFSLALLKEKYVALVPGDAFGSPGHLRISFATSEQAIKEGFRRIKEFLGC